MEEKCFLFDECNRKDCNAPVCIRRYKLESLYKNSLLTAQQRKHVILRVDSDGTDFDKYSKLAEFVKDVDKFVEDGLNLHIHGNCGTGKTTFAIRFIKEYFNRIWPKSDLGCKALFISVPMFLNQLKQSISKQNQMIDFILENIYSADLVVWDDIGDKSGTEYEINKLLSFIDNRISAGKSNIYTSNLSKKQIYDTLGDRLASRVCNYSIDVELNGADKRGIQFDVVQNGGNN